jgi:prepilin-type N-terminal cleavage/methylation domain-containing protein
VRNQAVLDPTGVKRCGPLLPRVAAGVTLVELLCVMSILAILASLLLPAVARAYGRARGFAEEFEAPEVASMLCHSTRNYCTANPQFQFTSKTDLADKCRLASKCRGWIEAGATEFIPFNYLTPTDQLVLQVHFGPTHLYSFTRGDLSTWPEDH